MQIRVGETICDPIMPLHTVEAISEALHKNAWHVSLACQSCADGDWVFSALPVRRPCDEPCKDAYTKDPHSAIVATIHAHREFFAQHGITLEDD